jgi:predicted transcriptional regulator
MASAQRRVKTSFKDIASTNIIFCDEEDTVTIIARKMRDNWVDTVFVKNAKNETVGIITDGIVWNLIAKEGDSRDPRILKAKEIMFKNFVKVKSDDPIESIDQLKTLFNKTKVNRISLVKDGAIVGLIPKKFIERIKRYTRNFSFSLKETT